MTDEQAEIARLREQTIKVLLAKRNEYLTKCEEASTERDMWQQELYDAEASLREIVEELEELGVEPEGAD